MVRKSCGSRVAFRADPLDYFSFPHEFSGKQSTRRRRGSSPRVTARAWTDKRNVAVIEPCPNDGIINNICASNIYKFLRAFKTLCRLKILFKAFQKFRNIRYKYTINDSIVRMYGSIIGTFTSGLTALPRQLHPACENADRTRG